MTACSTVADSLASLVQPVEQPAFIEKRGLRGVKEFGHVVGVEDARAETGHLAHRHRGWGT